MTSAVRRLRAAVIGCGTIAHEHLGVLSRSPVANLVAVCDGSAALADFAAQRYGAAAAFTDHREMLTKTHVDVVHVLTPPHTHVAIVSDALDAGADVICEKPMAPTAEATGKLLLEAKSKGRRLIESHNLLFNDEVIALDRLVNGGRIGSVKEIDVLLSLDLTAGPFGDLNLIGPGADLPAGAVHDFLPHLSYLFRHFAGIGSAPATASGYLQNVSGNPRVGYDHLDALVRAGSVRGRLRIASDTKPDIFRLVVRGSLATAETDFYNPFLRVEGGAYVGKLAPLEQMNSGLRLLKSGFANMRNKVRRHGGYHGLARMIDAFYATSIAGEPPPVTDAQIMASAALVDCLAGLRQDQ